MTEFELTLAGALRDHAEEIGMSTDQQRAAEKLQTRLDHVDGRRGRWYAVAAVAAVIVAVIVAALVVRPSRTDSGPPASDHPSAATVPYSNSSLTPPISLSLPSWTAHASTADDWFGGVMLEEASCSKLAGQSPCAADRDLKLRLLSLTAFYRQDGRTAVTRDPSYAAYVSHLDSLGSTGVATISERSAVTVGGRPGTAMSLAVRRDAPGAFACALASDPAADCMSLVAGRSARLAVVDQGVGVPPTVLYVSLNGDAPDRDQRFAEFDRMLRTVAFG